MIIDQRIAIFGGSSGIGLAVARACADAGAEVLVAARQKDKLDQALASIYGQVTGALVDVRQEDDVIRFFEHAGEIDHVISTVGWAFKQAPARDVNKESAQELINVKYWGQFMIAKHAAPVLTTGGSVTLTSGVLSSRPVVGFSVLASVNAAVEALARTLALELAPSRVNVVCPGFIDTGKLFPNLPREERLNQLQETKADGLPAKRVGTPGDAASAYLYALRNPYLTGQTLVVDGGASLL